MEAAHGTAPVLTCDSATELDRRHHQAVVACGSHGGVYPAYLAARAGLRAVILNDAGIGLQRAGLDCLAYCQALGMAAAVCAHDSAKIGDGTDMRRRGRISHANPIAIELGCQPGMTVDETLARLRAAPAWSGTPPAYREARTEPAGAAARRRVVCLDSASLVRPADTGQVVVTGSHGGLVGGRPETALRIEAFAVLFNDAGIGIDEAGVSRLPVLDRRGIAAATVAAASARIGDGLSTLQDGVLSRVNDHARRLGGGSGMRAGDFVVALSA